MSHYKKVLVAIDGSDESDTIVKKAVEIAAANKAVLSAVLVFEPLLGSYSFELNMADFETLQKQHQAMVAGAARKSLAKHGIAPQHLYDPCVSTLVGAWILSKGFARLGYNAQGLGAYNASSPEKREHYARQVLRRVAHLSAAHLLTAARGDVASANVRVVCEDVGDAQRNREDFRRPLEHVPSGHDLAQDRGEQLDERVAVVRKVVARRHPA
jgi:nucleotide-binding universal stress UspA family protein